MPNHVVVYLGDLGRNLQYEEQAYWKHFNITPGGRQPSKTNFRRSFHAEFSNPSEPDLVFEQSYTQPNEAWLARLGWLLFRPLHDDDAHILDQFRIPVSESLGEFEDQVLSLVKLVIDSLNEVELAKACGGALPDERGIGKLERFLQGQGYHNVSRDIVVLRLLQRLRCPARSPRKASSRLPDGVRRSASTFAVSSMRSFRGAASAISLGKPFGAFPRKTAAVRLSRKLSVCPGSLISRVFCSTEQREWRVGRSDR